MPIKHADSIILLFWWRTWAKFQNSIKHLFTKLCVLLSTAQQRKNYVGTVIICRWFVVTKIV